MRRMDEETSARSSAIEEIQAYLDNKTYNFTSKGVHAAGSLTRLDVAPNHWSHITLVIHETSVKVRYLVWVGAGDVGGPTRERVLQEVEHGEELARWNLHMVAEEAGNDRVVHHWLVGLVLEIAIPTRAELAAWPGVDLLHLLLGRSSLDTGLDAVGGKRTSAVDVPLREDLLLDLLVATDEVVERVGPWLGSVWSEGQVVVLEVETNAGKIDERLDTGLAELLWVANTRALEDQWGAERATTDNNQLAGFVSPGLVLRWVKRLRWDGLHTDSLAVLDDDLVGLGVDDQVQVLVVLAGAVDVSMGRVRAATSVPIDPLEPVLSTVTSDQVLEVICDGEALGFLDSVSACCKFGDKCVRTAALKKSCMTG